MLFYGPIFTRLVLKPSFVMVDVFPKFLNHFFPTNNSQKTIILLKFVQTYIQLVVVVLAMVRWVQLNPSIFRDGFVNILRCKKNIARIFKKKFIEQ